MALPPPKFRRYRGTDAKNRVSERKAKLLHAARHCIGTLGYHQTTVRSVCSKAGLTERYFYESFTNSETLLCAVYEQSINDLYHATMQAWINAEKMGIVSAAQKLECCFRAYLEFLRSNPEAARVILVEILGVSPKVDAFYRQTLKRFSAFIALAGRLDANARFETIRLTDELEPLTGEVNFLSIALGGGLYHIAKHWMELGFAPPIEQVEHAALTLLRALVPILHAPQGS